MKPVTFSLLLLCAVLLAFPKSALGQPKEAALDAAVEDALRAWKVPGAALAVVHDDRVVLLKGYGVKELGKKDPVTADTLFPIGSCTKAFTTAAMAILVDEKRMRWDDRVRRHLPTFHLADPLADAEVTLRDLVTHRTGVGTHDLLWYRAPWSPEDAVRRVGLLPLERPFRSTFQYQTTMFTAAGLAVSRTANMPWADFVQKRLLDPLGMKTAGCTTQRFRTDDRASGHRMDASEKVEVVPEWYPLAEAEPAGSIHASARDLVNWLRLHLNQGVVGDKRLISAAALGETHRPQIPLPLDGENGQLHPDSLQMSYGMGWVIQDYRGQLVISHAGVIDGFRVQITLLPRARLGFVVLANVYQSRMNLALSYRLIDLFLDVKGRDWNAYLRQVMEKSQSTRRQEIQKKIDARHRFTQPSLPARAYLGSYEHPAYGAGKIELEQGTLVWAWSRFRYRLVHFHHDIFVTEDAHLGVLFVTFRLAEDGTIRELELTEPRGVVFRKQRD